MKKIFTFFGILALCVSANAQTVIRNGSFENWTTVGSKLYPNNWDCDSFEVNINAIKRVSGGSNGSYALQLGSYTNAGTLYGAMVEIYDTITIVPGSLSFEYKVFNAPGFLNGLFIQIYFYDSSNFLRKFSYSAEVNNSAFRTGKIDIGFLAGEKPTQYRLEVSYFNAGTNTTEYTIVDNFRFGTATSSITNQLTASEINVWPNPATDLINLSNLEVGTVKNVRLISMDGRTQELMLKNSTIDVSAICKGIYILEIIDKDDRLIKREKVSIKG